MQYLVCVGLPCWRWIVHPLWTSRSSVEEGRTPDTSKWQSHLARPGLFLDKPLPPTRQQLQSAQIIHSHQEKSKILILKKLEAVKAKRRNVPTVIWQTLLPCLWVANISRSTTNTEQPVRRNFGCCYVDMFIILVNNNEKLTAHSTGQCSRADRQCTDSLRFQGSHMLERICDRRFTQS